MDQTVVEMIRDLIRDVKDDVRILDEKVDKILQFKWQIIGGSLVVSAFFSIAISIVLAVIGQSK